ncbi:MAG: ribonuclease Z [Desulfobacteraceae bacterium]
MHLTVLGSGTSIPLSYRASPSLMLNVDGEILLLDMGPGTLRQLARAGINNSSISHVLFSHFHPDHTADLIHFLFVTRNPLIFNKREPFILSGSKGLKNLIDKLQKAYPGWLELPEDKMIIEEYSNLETAVRSYEKYTVSTYPVDHTESSLAYRIEDKNSKSIVYTGDTDFCEGISSFAEGADLLILECSLPEGGNTKGHLNPVQAGRLASLSGAKKLMLVHFYPEVLSTDITGECRKFYNGELILGRDMLQIKI